MVSVSLPQVGQIIFEFCPELHFLVPPVDYGFRFGLALILTSTDIHARFLNVKEKSTTKTEDREKIAVWLDKPQITKMRKIQETEDVPIAAQIRRAIDEFLERRKK